MSTHKSMRRFRGEGGVSRFNLHSKTTENLSRIPLENFNIPRTLPSQNFLDLHMKSHAVSVSTVQCTHLFQNMSTFSVHTFSPSIIVCQQFKCIHMYRICQHIQLVQYLSSFQSDIEV